jgi:hypothetical protein
MTNLNSQKSKRVSLVCLAAMTMIFGVAAISFSLQFGAAFASDQQSSLLSDNGIGAATANRKVQCIMPPAWRRNCSE